MFDAQVLYVGDVSEIPERSWDVLLHRRPSGTNGSALENGNSSSKPRGDTQLIENLTSNLTLSSETTAPPLSILIIDALWPNRSHVSHFSLAQAMTTALRLNPQRTYVLGTTHPTSHYMWEEVCRSFRGLDGERPDHPEAEVTKALVERVKSHSDFKGEGGLGEKATAWGGVVEPAWDGLILESTGVGGEVSEIDVEHVGQMIGWTT
jgi:hypothetical protein